ncbi:MAG: cation/cationic drug transporter [Candidatus Woesearchaeota archaeon]
MKRNTAVLMIIFSTFLNTIAQTLYKYGAANLKLDFLAIITNYPIIIGICIYAVSASIMIIAFRGGDLSLLYPLFATGYIWVTLVSSYIFNEELNLYKIAGILIIVVGVSVLGFASDKETTRVEAI